MSLPRLAIALATVGGAVTETESRGDAVCILAIGVILFILAGAYERRRK